MLSLGIGCYNARPSSSNNNTHYDCRLILLCLHSRSVMRRLSGGFPPFFGFPVLLPRCSYLALGCNLWLSPNGLLYGNILSFDCVRSSGSLDACRPFSGPTPGIISFIPVSVIAFHASFVALVLVVITSSVGISISTLGSVAVVPPERSSSGS